MSDLGRGAGPALTDAIRADVATAAAVVRVAAEVGTQIDTHRRWVRRSRCLTWTEGAGPALTGALRRRCHRRRSCSGRAEVDASATTHDGGRTQPYRRGPRSRPRPHRRPSGQTLPQAPQLFGSLERSTQTPPQLVSVSTQAIGGALQIPPSQTPSGQTVPQAPQLFESLLRSMQKPLHSTRGETQPRLICGQTPLAQTPSGQTLPHPPQLFGSLLMSTHPPPPQSTVGRTQPISTRIGKQVPPSQTPLGQAMPQPPQLKASLHQVDASTATAVDGG